MTRRGRAPGGVTRPAMMRCDAGELFVEALVAAAIVALALGATLQVVADGAARDRKIEARRDALLVAQSELAAVGADIPLRAGQTAGAAGDLVWRVDVSPYTAEGEANAAGALWKVVVTVRSREPGPVLAALRSVRLGPEA